MLSGRGACPIEDWIERRCRDRRTSIIAYIIRLGTKRDRRLAFAGLWCMVHGAWRKSAGGGDPSIISGLRGVAGFLKRWTGPEESRADPPPTW